MTSDSKVVFSEQIQYGAFGRRTNRRLVPPPLSATARRRAAALSPGLEHNAPSLAAGAGGAPDAARVNATVDAYESLLLDVDALLATDGAFQLGGWTAAARALAEADGASSGGDAGDCYAEGFPEVRRGITLH